VSLLAFLQVAAAFPSNCSNTSVGNFTGFSTTPCIAAVLEKRAHFEQQLQQPSRINQQDHVHAATAAQAVNVKLAQAATAL
jgi:hypothetical protein